MNFDVIIPTKNRPNDLMRLLDSIEEQTQLPQNVIIIDQSESFNEIEKKYHYKITHIHNKQLTGLTSAKNEGVRHSSSEILYFFDDDIILYKNFFEIINNQFSSKEDISGICGRQINSKSSRFKIFMFELFHRGCFKDIRKKCNSGYVKEELKETNILPGGITAYRKKIFNEFSFDEHLIKYCLGEDMDFSYRVGQKHKLAFSTTALAIHNHSTIGRYNAYDSFGCKVAGYSYFFHKNISKDAINYMAYCLVEIGVFFDAIQYALTRFDVNSIKGFINGLKMVHSKFKNVPFIAQ